MVVAFDIIEGGIMGLEPFPVKPSTEKVWSKLFSKMLRSEKFFLMLLILRCMTDTLVLIFFISFVNWFGYLYLQFSMMRVACILK